MNQTPIGIALLVLLMISSLARAAPDIMSGTWHLGINALFGRGVRRGQPFTKNLDIYPVFEKGKMVNALATARTYNTSIHMLESTTVAVDPATKTIAGKMQIVLTPDQWQPASGLVFRVDIEIEGKIVVSDDGQSARVEGTYSGKRTDGGALGDEEGVIKGKLGGAVGVNEAGWDDAVWSAGLTQIVGGDHIDVDAVNISLGIANGKVNWATLGLSAQAKWSSFQAIPLDVSAFGKVTEANTVTGKTTITARHLHPAGDPAETFTLELAASRVQGLIGMKAKITPDSPKTGVWPRMAYGRGSGSKGGGGERTFNGLWRHELDKRPWFSDVSGFVEPAAGEHPRLLFRKSDLNAIRARARRPRARRSSHACARFSAGTARL